MKTNPNPRVGAYVAPPVLIVLLVLASRQALAHEGHAALPTKGATVQGDQLLLSSGAAKAIGMTLAKVELKDLSRHITVNAHVELPWHQQAVVTSLVSGRIEELLVKPGDRVQRGQALLRLSSAELEKLQLDLLKAQAELQLAERLLRQRSELRGTGRWRAKLPMKPNRNIGRRQPSLRLHAKLVALGIAPEKLEQLLEDSSTLRSLTIAAPRDGSIVHADVRVGQVIEPSEHLFDIVDDSRLWVVGNVLEADASLVRRGQRVSVTLDALDGTVIEGEIEGVDVHLDSDNRTLPIYLTLENEEHLLRAGMTGRMKVENQRVEKAVVVPSNALIQEGEHIYVLVQEGPGKFRKRRVKLGLTLPEEAEVIDGLFPGNRVIQAGKVVLASLFGRAQAPRRQSQPPVRAGSLARTPPCSCRE